MWLVGAWIIQNISFLSCSRVDPPSFRSSRKWKSKCELGPLVLSTPPSLESFALTNSSLLNNNNNNKSDHHPPALCYLLDISLLSGQQSPSNSVSTTVNFQPTARKRTPPFLTARWDTVDCRQICQSSRPTDGTSLGSLLMIDITASTW